MFVGTVLSHNEGFYAYKGNKIVIHLKTPVFQVVISDKDLTCISKKIEFFLAEDIKTMKAKVMGREYDSEELKFIFPAITPSMWISTKFENDSNLEATLDGIAKTAGGKVIFVNEFKSLDEVFPLLLKQAQYETVKNRTTIKEYCEKNIELLNNQIRILTTDKNSFQDILNQF